MTGNARTGTIAKSYGRKLDFWLHNRPLVRKSPPLEIQALLCDARLEIRTAASAILQGAEHAFDGTIGPPLYNLSGVYTTS